MLLLLRTEMPVGPYKGILVYAPPRTGKGLWVASQAQSALRAGQAVATNIDFNLDVLCSPKNRTRVWRVPDWPLRSDLDALPLGNPGLYRDEHGQIQTRPGWSPRNDGLLILDELGTFLESRNWQKNGRDEIISWFLQAGKFGWRRIFIAQGPKLIDSQIRSSCVEVYALVRDLESFVVPYIGGLLQSLGFDGTMPAKVGVAARLGMSENSPQAWRDWVKKDRYFGTYNTNQVFHPDVGIPSGGGYWMLSAWELKGRYMSFWQLHRAALALTAVVALTVGAVGGRYASRAAEFSQKLSGSVVDSGAAKKFADVAVSGVFESGGLKYLILKDGKVLPVSIVHADSTGYSYQSGGLWYRGQ